MNPCRLANGHITFIKMRTFIIWCLTFMNVIFSYIHECKMLLPSFKVFGETCLYWNTWARRVKFGVAVAYVSWPERLALQIPPYTNSRCPGSGANMVHFANQHAQHRVLNTLTSIQGFYRVFGSTPVGRLAGTIKGPFKSTRYCLEGEASTLGI